MPFLSSAILVGRVRQLYDEALKAYNQAVLLDSSDAISYAGLGNLYTKLKQYDEAIKVYQKSLTLQPQNGQTYLQWVKDNGNKNFVEYALAVAELKSLEKEAAPQ